MSSLLLRSAPGTAADLFHALPLDILDPFLYAEHDGRKVAVTGVLERDRIEALGLGIEVLDPFSLGLDTLLEQGVGFLDAEIEVDLRACRELGLESAIVPPDFTLAWADKLRGAGIELAVDADAFDLRRRVKTDAQLAGIRRAQVAAEAAMGAAAELLRELPAGLTCEQVRERMQAICKEHDAELPDTAIVAHGAQSASGHEEGHGRIDRGGIVLIDIWPRDRASRCWADMTRTFVAGGGEPPEELASYWRLTMESLQTARAQRVRRAAESRTLVDLEPDAVAEAVVVAVAQDLAVGLRQLRRLARGDVGLARAAEDRVRVGARPHLGIDELERPLRQLPVLLQLGVGRAAAGDERARHVGPAARLAVARPDVDDHRLARGDRAGADLVAVRRLRAVRDDHVAG